MKSQRHLHMKSQHLEDEVVGVPVSSLNIVQVGNALDVLVLFMVAGEALHI